jgi:hypothetical protein
MITEKSDNMFLIGVFVVFVALAFGGWSIYTEHKAQTIASNFGTKPDDLRQFAAVKMFKASCNLNLPYVADRALAIYSDQHAQKLKPYEDSARDALLGNPIAFGLTKTLGCPLVEHLVAAMRKSYNM